jgi:hypothetical protein
VDVGDLPPLVEKRVERLSATCNGIGAIGTSAPTIAAAAAARPVRGSVNSRSVATASRMPSAAAATSANRPTMSASSTGNASSNAYRPGVPVSRPLQTMSGHSDVNPPTSPHPLPTTPNNDLLNNPG